MPDILGTRLKVGSLVPSTNSSVEPEFCTMAVPGVTHMAARIAIPNQTFSSDADAAAIVEATQADLLPALARLMACNPDRVVMAMAVPCFWGGIAGCDALRERLTAAAGVPVTMPPDAVARALDALGARRIAVVSPYMPLADRHVAEWFTGSGYDVAAIRGLRAPVEDEVVNITPEALEGAMREVDGEGVEALVHVGTSIAAARLVEGLEARLGKPVVSVNVALWWATLRAAGIDDRRRGYGRLLADH
ncbi:maleate cis-trans isomerase family protein [Acuticoccus sp.]|uniref:maleate cis-trans isomerase family protein n=1 Tax=Acuticoccus sp. TaxID=1904378 RepID=UPI003B52DF1D